MEESIGSSLLLTLMNLQQESKRDLTPLHFYFLIYGRPHRHTIFADPYNPIHSQMIKSYNLMYVPNFRGWRKSHSEAARLLPGRR